MKPSETDFKGASLGNAVGPFALYDDEDNTTHVIDGGTRIVLSDSFAYDGNAWETDARMKWVCNALNAAWAAQQATVEVPV